MNIVMQILLPLFFIILPLGDVFRIQLNNGISLLALDGVAEIIFVFVIIKSIKNSNFLKKQLVKPILLFCGISFFSLMVNIPTLTFFQLFVSSLYLIRWISFASLYFFIAHLDVKNRKKLFYYMLFTGLFFVISGFTQYILYPNLVNLYYLGWDLHYLRLFSTFFDPNFAGIFLVLYFLFLLDIAIKMFEKKKKTLTILFGILCLVTCFAIFLTLSRDAFIVLLVGIVTYLILQGKKGNFSVLGVVIPLFLLTIFFLAKLPTEGAHIFRIPSSIARVTEAKHALTIIFEHPVFGVGFNAFRYAQLKHGYLAKSSWETSHAAAGTDNSFLFILATTGIIGFCMYLYLLYRILYGVFTQRTASSILTFSSVIVIIVSSFFINSLFYPPIMAWMWILLGITENT